MSDRSCDSFKASFEAVVIHRKCLYLSVSVKSLPELLDTLFKAATQEDKLGVVVIVVLMSVPELPWKYDSVECLEYTDIQKTFPKLKITEICVCDKLIIIIELPDIKHIKWSSWQFQRN